MDVVDDGDEGTARREGGEERLPRRVDIDPHLPGVAFTHRLRRILDADREGECSIGTLGIDPRRPVDPRMEANFSSTTSGSSGSSIPARCFRISASGQ